MKARILRGGPDGTDLDVTGRTIESIARTRYGRDVQVRQEHSDLTDPGVIRWTVTRWVEAANAHSVLGTIVTWPTRPGPGRPPKHDEPTVRFPLRLPKSVHAEVTATAATSGRSVNDEITRRVIKGAPGMRQHIVTKTSRDYWSVETPDGTSLGDVLGGGPTRDTRFKAIRPEAADANPEAAPGAFFRTLEEAAAHLAS